MVDFEAFAPICNGEVTENLDTAVETSSLLVRAGYGRLSIAVGKAAHAVAVDARADHADAGAAADAVHAVAAAGGAGYAVAAAPIIAPHTDAQSVGRAATGRADHAVTAASIMAPHGGSRADGVADHTGRSAEVSAPHGVTAAAFAVRADAARRGKADHAGSGVGTSRHGPAVGTSLINSHDSPPPTCSFADKLHRYTRRTMTQPGGWCNGRYEGTWG